MVGEEDIEKRWNSGTPESQFFEIHGSKFEPHPGRNPGQTTVMCITHTMFFLGVSKDPFNGFFAQGIYLLAALGFAQLLGQIKVLLPDMGGQQALPLFIGAAGLPARAALAYFGGAAISPPSVLAGGGMSQFLAPWADKTVMFRIISKIPGAKLIFPAFITGIRENGDTAVL